MRGEFDSRRDNLFLEKREKERGRERGGERGSSALASIQLVLECDIPALH